MLNHFTRPRVRQLCSLVVVLSAVLGVPTAASAQSETIEYYGLDALGSVRVIFDQQGNVIDRMDYGPFGENLRAAIRFPTEQFAQLARDAESGQDYAQARNYSAGTGRFNRVDPIYAGLFRPQAWNRYSYALNNPATLVDPNGQDPIAALAGFAAWCASNCPTRPPDGAPGSRSNQFQSTAGTEEAMRALDEVETIASWWDSIENPFSTFLDYVGERLDEAAADRDKFDGCVSAGGGLGCLPSDMEVSMAGLPNGASAAAAAAAAAAGRFGEQAVRNIGPKTVFFVNGVKRIADGMKGNVISEVKNVAYQALTRQMRDYFSYLEQNPSFRFDLYIRVDPSGRAASQLSQPLQAEISRFGPRVTVNPVIPSTIVTGGR
jgi:RHS repeat-associated protein